MSTIVLRSDLTVASGELISKQISPRTTVYLCAECGTSIYSESIKFPSTYIMRGGVFDDPMIVEPGAHLWVKRKHPWIELPADVPQFAEDYDPTTTWPREALARMNAANEVLPSSG